MINLILFFLILSLPAAIIITERDQNAKKKINKHDIF